MLNWNSNTFATWCKELTHLRRPWCWERLRAGGEGDDRAWDGWMVSPTQWTWVWVDSGSWWWTGRPGVLQFMGSQRVGHDWATELNWPDTSTILLLIGSPNMYCIATAYPALCCCWRFRGKNRPGPWTLRIYNNLALPVLFSVYLECSVIFWQIPSFIQKTSGPLI